MFTFILSSILSVGSCGTVDTAGDFIVCSASDYERAVTEKRTQIVLGDDIELVYPFKMLGDGANSAFTGSIDGQGHTVRLTVPEKTEKVGVGLIGYAKDAQVHDINVVFVKRNLASSYYGGLIAHGTRVDIFNARASGCDAALSDGTGCLAGTLYDSSVYKCHVDGVLHAQPWTDGGGAIVGLMSGTTVTDCDVSVTVDFPKNRFGMFGVGGAVGYAESSTVRDVYGVVGGIEVDEVKAVGHVVGYAYDTHIAAVIFKTRADIGSPFVYGKAVGGTSVSSYVIPSWYFVPVAFWGLDTANWILRDYNMPRVRISE